VNKVSYNCLNSADVPLSNKQTDISSDEQPGILQRSVFYIRPTFWKYLQSSFSTIIIISLYTILYKRVFNRHAMPFINDDGISKHPRLWPICGAVWFGKGQAPKSIWRMRFGATSGVGGRGSGAPNTRGVERYTPTQLGGVHVGRSLMGGVRVIILVWRNIMSIRREFYFQ